MDTKTKLVKVTLADGTPAYIQTRKLSSEEDVAFKVASFEKVTKAIEGIAESLTAAWDKVKPTRASVEFSVEFAWDAGEVLALFVDSSTTASMKITLDWGEPSAS